MVSLSSVYQALPDKTNLALLTPVPTKLAYVSMLFIIKLACTACIAGHLKNKSNTQIN